MKSEIMQSYRPREEYSINSILNIDKEKTIIFSSKYSSNSYIDLLVNGKVVDSLDLSEIDNFNTSGYYKAYFKTNNGFGMIYMAEEILFWDSIDLQNYKLIKILNPFLPDKHQRKTYASKAFYDENSNELICCLHDYFASGFPPRYISNLKFEDNKKFFGLFGSNTGAKWSSLFELPKHNFPPTEFSKYNDNSDWLNIKELFVKNSNIYIHSTGGTSTRLKSGKDYEYNVIAMFDMNRNWCKNFEIKEGIGIVNTNKEYFILHPREKKSRLYFYNTDNFTIEFELSLTSKQNLGEENYNQMYADLIDNKLYVFNHKFLNICQLIN